VRDITLGEVLLAAILVVLLVAMLSDGVTF